MKFFYSVFQKNCATEALSHARMMVEYLAIVCLYLCCTPVNAQPTIPASLCEEVTPLPTPPISLCEEFNINESQYLEVGDALTTMSDVIAALGQPSADFSGMYFRVRGPFFIDIPTQLHECVIRVDNGAGIFIANDDAIFDCTGSVFFSCTVMWQGISLMPEAGNTTISLNGCRIEDANAALDLSAAISPTIVIVDTRFNNNYIGIYCDATFSNPRPILNLVLSDVEFTCNASSLRPGASHPGTGPTFNDMSWAGIEVHKATLTFGQVGVGYPATFDGLRAGIRGDEVLLNINNCHFKNMRGGLNKNAPLSTGWGIVVYNKSSLAARLCKFDFNRQGGVFSERSDIRVLNCSFNYCGYGVFSEENLNVSSIIINQNKILMASQSLGGILVDRPSRDLQIMGNDITRAGSTNTLFDPLDPVKRISAIDVKMARPISATGLFTISRISGNKYTDHTARNAGYWAGDNGLRLWNAIPPLAGVGSFLVASNNNFEYTVPTTTYGKIGIEITDLIGSQNTRVFNNNLTAMAALQLPASAPNPGQTQRPAGLRQYNSQGLYICENNINNFSNGMFFKGDNNPVRLAENYFNNNFLYGLLIEGGGIGDQIRTANIWSQPQPATATAAQIDAPFMATSRYVTADASPDMHPTNVSPSSWFVIESGPLNGCSLLSRSLGEGGELNSSDRMALSGAIDQTSLSSYEKWLYELNLMRKLLNNNSLTQTDTRVSDYYNQKINRSVGKFAQLYYLMEAPSVQRSSLLDQISQKDSLLDIRSIRIIEIDSTLHTGGLISNTVQQLNQEKSVSQSDIKQLFAERITLQEQLNQLHTTQYQNAIAVNNSIVPETVFETNLKDFNQVWLNSSITGSLSATHIVTLRRIASQDPEIGGGAVTAAQNLIPVECPYNNGLRLGSDASVSVMPTVKNSTPSDIKMFPNPSTGQVFWTGPINSQVSVKVFNLIGQLVAEGVTESNQIDLGHLANGLYSIQVLGSDNNLIGINKIQIQK